MIDSGRSYADLVLHDSLLRMASTVLANQTAEQNWASPSHQVLNLLANRRNLEYMGKSSSNPGNFNHKSSKKKQRLHSLPVIEIEEPTAGGISHPSASDDASSINRRPALNHRIIDSSGYVTFNLTTFSKTDLIELKFRLTSELSRIRQLKTQIESSGFPKKPSQNKPKSKPKPNLSGSKRTSSSSVKEPLPNLPPDKPSLLKKCSEILSKLMKHKHSYIFNSPVDAISLNLHDYHEIIKCPMDLGTVKLNLSKGFYNSPTQFASDVKLTFQNAMKYNPKGHEVYTLAETLLTRFEEWFKPVKEAETLLQMEEQQEVDEGPAKEVEASSWDQKSKPKQAKQPKPKAKDVNKRDMTMEEKHKLGAELQLLPPEKMENVVVIIKKRNGIEQHGDEIELDIETLDTETLWELDRFITNYKKFVSKMKRRGMLAATAGTVPQAGNGNAVDDDVDIGEEVPVSSFPPVEIEKDVGNGNASSSGESSSSSGSESDTGSESDSGSESEKGV